MAPDFRYPVVPVRESARASYYHGVNVLLRRPASTQHLITEATALANLAREIRDILDDSRFGGP
jgi:hypothetical protein